MGLADDRFMSQRNNPVSTASTRRLPVTAELLPIGGFLLLALLALLLITNGGAG